MKIALINPPYPPLFALVLKILLIKNDYSFPLGLGYIAAYTRRAGHTVKIFDPEPSGMPLELMWKEVEKFKPDLVGITSVTPNFMPARELVMEAKRRLGCLVVMGGPHVNALPRSTLRSIPVLDAVILGEGELPMLALADYFDANGRVDFNKVPGAAFIERSCYRENPRPEPISGLDDLPYPAFDLVDMELYRRHRYLLPSIKSATLISSRGCPSQCTFCANIIMGRKFRAHSPGYVIGEMEHLAGNYGIRHFHFYDDCFTADPRRISELCDLLIARRMNVLWEAAGRVNTLLDEALLEKMKRAGCIQVLLGIETGDQRILDLMKKGATLKMAERCCSLLRKHGIGYSNSFIIGNDGDTEETIADTIAFAKKMRSDLVSFVIMIPFPGTPLFDKYYKDYDSPDTNWRNWSSQLPDRPYEPRQTALSMKDLVRLQRTAYNRFYADPLRLLRTLTAGVGLKLR